MATQQDILTLDSPIPTEVPHEETKVAAEQMVEPVLKFAIDQFDRYDQAAIHQKNNHVRSRAIVLLLGFAATLIAVVSGVTKQILPVGFDDVFGLILFIIPLIVTGIMAYQTRIIPSDLWVKYRYTAEIIRREIYHYLMGAGKYAKLDLIARQKTLLGEVQKAAEVPEVPIELFEAIPQAVPASTPMLNVRTRGEEWGDVDKYIETRLLDQYQWYTKKCSADFKATRYWQIAGLIISGAGTLLAYLDAHAWVAVTTAGGIVITQLATLRMYGRIYSLYATAARKLNKLYLEWKIQPPEYTTNRENIIKFVADCEAIFAEEMTSWVDQAQSAVAEAEQGIGRLVAQTDEDEKDTEKLKLTTQKVETTVEQKVEKTELTLEVDSSEAESVNTNGGVEKTTQK